YENPALSHFVSTDIWMSGQAEAEPSGTGWLGRYLEHAHPEYHATPPDSPVALQVGASGSMLFQGNAGSMGVTFPSTSALTRLAQGGAVYDTEDVPDGILGQELAFVRNISNHSFGHAESIKDAYDTGRNTRSYPGGNSLSDSLRTVARLIRGGLGARVYHVSLGGFDTHANQLGTHATLLRRLGDATAAFMADLAADGHSEHVVAMTFSEFGRRIRANGSAGTDHGTAAPLFMMGEGLAGGVIGGQPDLANLDANGNLVAAVDFRSVYASVFTSWFGMDPADLGDVIQGGVPTLPLFAGSVSTGVAESAQPDAFELVGLYPNPAQSTFTVVFDAPGSGPVLVRVLDMLGREVITPRPFGGVRPGRHRTEVTLGDRVASGRYVVEIRQGHSRATTLLTVAR
ncbi:MAG: DUF1501 domain-containing protein, partial [Rhodothermales bacterium]|nr:DUF1501 domain-containing protein [Rhodothermales bacterium]